MNAVLFSAGAVLVAATTASASAQAPTGGERLAIIERWSTTGAPGDKFVSIAGMAEGPDGRIWVSDPRAGTIHALSADGRPARRIARAGDGPGEVRGPHMITRTADGGIAVHDLGHNAIQVFDAQGRFRHRVPLQRPVTNAKGFAALPSGGFLLSGGIYGEDHSIHRYGPAGDLERSWLPIPRTTNVRAGVLVAGGPVAMLSGGDILFSRAAPHEIIVFSPDGERRRTLAADPRLLRPIGDDFIEERGTGSAMVRTFRWMFPQSRAVFQLRDGRILNVVRFHDEGASLWELYSEDGRRLNRVRVGRAYSPWALTASGDVLASYIDPDTDEHVAVRLALVER